MNVAVIGASNKPDRYSYKALKLLQENGHHVFPVHQRIQEIEGVFVYKTIEEIPEALDVITFYVSKEISMQMIRSVLDKNPKRIIFNPGAENAELEKKAKENGIETMKACTLVMLKTGQF